MKAAIRSRALTQIFLVTVFGAALSAAPASAQKAGGRLAGFVRCGKTITNAADEKPQGSHL